jgi:diguanylate cyclase (GGDEF)-like protein
LTLGNREARNSRLPDSVIAMAAWNDSGGDQFSAQERAMNQRRPQHRDVTYHDRYAKELEMLYGALDQMPSGIVLLDELLRAQFLNRAARELWRVSDEQAAQKPSYVDLAVDPRRSRIYGVPSDQLGQHLASRIATVDAGDPTPIDIPHSDGRIIRSQCAVLPNGGRMVTYTDVTDLTHRARRFEQLATIDGMTGLYNRRHFDAVADSEWKRFQRYHRPLSLMMMDIDRFKQVNDGHGHEVGDRAIKLVASVCAAEKRGSDTAARFGGDEFAVLLPETDVSQARIAAERLRQAVFARSRAADPADGIVPISVSIGIAEATASMPVFATLMRLADQGLYVAKAAGRNGVGCAEPLAAPVPRAAE